MDTHTPRATKIVATLGPASSEPAVLERLLQAGVDVVRLNFSHGKAQDHIDRAALVRAAAERVGKPVALMAADELRRFGLPPKVAFLSHSIFGSSSRASAKRMRAARDLFVARAPHIECDGEMHGDAALSESVRHSYLPDSTLHGSANLLVLPNLDAANILFNILKVTSGHGVTIGPMLLGAAKPVHILTPSSTMRRVVNMTALVVADAAEMR